MASPQKPRSNFLQLALIFAVIYIGSQFVLKQYFPDQFGGKQQISGVQVKFQSASITEGHHPDLVIENKTLNPLPIPSRCPRPPVDIFYVENPGATPERLTKLDATDIAIPCTAPATVLAGTTVHLSLAPWKYSIFSKLGVYEVRLPITGQGSGAVVLPGNELGTQAGTGSSASQWKAPSGASSNVVAARVTMKEPGPLTKAFRTFILAPLLNLLVFIASIVPFHDLGLSIILLTILVKLVLFIPTQKAMEGQKKMQMLQPKLEVLKKKYPDDPKKVQEETMKLWKEHKINPFSSCLPMLLQFPVLIGLFYVIRDGSHLELSRHLIYPYFQHLNWHFNTNFLGLDLLQPNVWLMPPLLVLLQFFQMRLTFSIADKKKKDTEGIIDVGDKKEPASAQQMQQKMMLYGLPLMIGVFAFQFPAAVALYWGISTVFAIGQQVIVNREHLRV